MEEGEQQARKEESWMQQLPAFKDLVQRFSLFSTSQVCNPQIGHGGSLNCTCEGCSQWHAFVEGTAPNCKEVHYEVFTLEHVEGLARYLLGSYYPGHVWVNEAGQQNRKFLVGRMQAAEYKLPVMNVLEVGAGSGRLCDSLNYFLSQSTLLSQGCVVRLTATDRGDKGLNGPKVLKQDAFDAISEANPHLVLVSWMPIGVDWTAHMRATPSVLEYILIGEIDEGICGDPWLTWGYTDVDIFSDSSSEDPTCVNIRDGPFKSKSFSNYGPGRPVDMIHMDTESSPLHFCDCLGNATDQVCPRISIGCKERVEKKLVESSPTTKRLRLDNNPFAKSSTSTGVSAAIAKAISPRKISGTAEHKGLQTVSDKKNADGSTIPPYAADGWVRTELASLSSVQICRTDERWSTLQHSHTVSFRR